MTDEEFEVFAKAVRGIVELATSREESLEVVIPIKKLGTSMIRIDFPEVRQPADDLRIVNVMNVASGETVNFAGKA